MLPLRRQSSARATRPPSSGKAGTRLKPRIRQVDLRLVADHRSQRCRRRFRQPEGERAEDRGDHRGHRGPGEREAQFVAGAPGAPTHPRHSAEQPKVDLLNLDTAPARDKSVAELVREDAGEQEQGACEPQRI